MGIEVQALLNIDHIGIRNQHFHVGIYLHVAHKVEALFEIFAEEVLEFFFFQFAHCLVEYTLIGFVTNIRDEAALLPTQKVSCPPNIEVTHSYIEATSQFTKLLQRTEAAAGFRSQYTQWRRHQITECTLIGAPHPAPKLVQITEAKLMRIIDDHRIGVRNIQARFDDVGTNQYLVAAINKINEYPLQFLRLHLAVGHGYIYIGHQAAYQRSHICQALHPVVYKENLATTLNFVVDGILDQLFLKNAYFRMNRPPVRWRCTDNRQVAGSHQAKLQRSRDGGSREGERIYIHLHIA